MNQSAVLEKLIEELDIPVKRLTVVTYNGMEEIMVAFPFTEEAEQKIRLLFFRMIENQWLGSFDRFTAEMPTGIKEYILVMKGDVALATN